MKIGLPNAGKSSFLQSVTRCKSSIGSWAFTTLNPYLGTIQYPAELDQDKILPPIQVSIADIPGIVEGASMNRGLGHSFLRHIEKSKLQIYVVDLSRPDPRNDLKILMNELESYRTGLALGKPGLVIANKADMIGILDNNGNPIVQSNLEMLKSYLEINFKNWDVGMF